MPKTATKIKQVPTEKITEVKKLPDGTIEIKVTIPWSEVEIVRKEVIDALVAEVELQGFRKGKAPRDLAEKSLSKEKVKEQVLKKVISASYADIIAKNEIKPIIYPQIHVEEFDEGTKASYTAKTCEAPTVELKDYKDAVKSLTSKSKIVIPGKSEEERKIPLDEILKTALNSTVITISEVLTEQEATRLLSQFLDELKTLGMTLDSYLASKGITGEKLREEYKKKAEEDIKLEFLLRKIADEEKITVEKEDIEKAINEISDPKQKDEISKNPYLVASIIRQQKTLDFLSKI